jgi:hypothetical protein
VGWRSLVLGPGKHSLKLPTKKSQSVEKPLHRITAFYAIVKNEQTKRPDSMGIGPFAFPKKTFHPPESVVLWEYPLPEKKV